MRHTIWLMAVVLVMLTACTLSTPTPKEAATPTAVATVVPEQPAPTLPDAGDLQPTPTPQASPTSTASPTVATPATKVPAVARVQAAVPTPSYPYRLQSGTPAELQNFLNTDGCNYLGVGGQVLKLNGNAVTGLVVEITGTLSSKNVLYLALTGTAQNLGPGGYEIKIDTQPVDSTGTLKIQVFDLNGVPQTPLIPINTIADCNKNFVLVNFSEQFPIKTLFLFPVIRK
jgi:hypothetical protein